LGLVGLGLCCSGITAQRQLSMGYNGFIVQASSGQQFPGGHFPLSTAFLHHYAL
jgi:hypothetical protein